MNEKISQFKAGLKDGIPIGLGYLAVSFTFGIMAKGAGLTTLEAVVLSFLISVNGSIRIRYVTMAITAM